MTWCDLDFLGKELVMELFIGGTQLAHAGTDAFHQTGRPAQVDIALSGVRNVVLDRDGSQRVVAETRAAAMAKDEMEPDTAPRADGTQLVEQWSLGVALRAVDQIRVA